MVLERLAPVVPVQVHVNQKMQWGLPKTVALVKAMVPDSLGGDHRRRWQWPWMVCFSEPLGLRPGRGGSVYGDDGV
jgi:hypothetical protein